MLLLEHLLVSGKISSYMLIFLATSLSLILILDYHITIYRSNQKRTMQKIFNMVPFVLKKESHCVEVIDPLSANILDLDVISNHYEPIVPTIIDHLWGFLTGKLNV